MTARPSPAVRFPRRSPRRAASPARAGALTALLAALLAARTLPAQELDDARDARDDAERPRTVVQVTPYVWATGVSGALQPRAGGPSVRVRRGFGDLLEDLNGAFFLSALGRRDRFVAVADLSYASASRGGLVPTGNPAAPVVPAEARLRQTSLTFVAGYRMVEERDATLDLLGGVRGWWLRPAVAAPALGASASPRFNFADPILAARGTLPLRDRLRFLIYVDVGGFGMGSQLTTQSLGTLNWRAGRRAWLSAGYRALTVDRDARGIRVDATLQGPMLGGSWVF